MFTNHRLYRSEPHGAAREKKNPEPHLNRLLALPARLTLLAGSDPDLLPMRRTVGQRKSRHRERRVAKDYLIRLTPRGRFWNSCLAE